MTTLTIPSLLEVLRDHSLDDRLADRLDPTLPGRQWLRLDSSDDFELWLISWPAGTGAGWHDHGAASGAFTVLRGTLTEYTWDVGDGSSSVTETDPAVTHQYSQARTFVIRLTVRDSAGRTGL